MLWIWSAESYGSEAEDRELEKLREIWMFCMHMITELEYTSLTDALSIRPCRLALTLDFVSSTTQ